jgi:hypothetical protein
MPRPASRRAGPARPAAGLERPRRAGASAPAFDPNEEIVLRPYLRGTLALLVALPSDRPIGLGALARAVGGQTPAWDRFVGQLVELRLADDVGLDARPLLLITPAGLILREQLSQPQRTASRGGPTLLERLRPERLALLEALAEVGPLTLGEVIAACRHLPGHLREPPLARSEFLALARRRRLVEPVPGDEALEPAKRRHRAADAAWRVVAARRRLHPSAYSLTAFAACLAELRLGRNRPVGASTRPRRRRSPVPGQLSLF